MIDTLVVLTKQPRKGLSKTRLAADVGGDLALRLAEAFVGDTLALERSLARSAPAVEPWIAFAPAAAEAWFRSRAPWARLVPQPEGDLGVRMRAALRAAFAAGARRCAVIGTDAPHLGPERIAEALASLERADLCLGPSRDGGYYLIAAKADRPELFEGIPWSTGDVLRSTLERAAQAGLEVHLLEEDFDVDDGADLTRLTELLETRPGLAPATRAVLGLRST